MGKIFIYFLLLLSIGAHAQIYTANGFQSSLPGTGDQRGWVYSIRGFQRVAGEWGYYNLSNAFRCNDVVNNRYYGGRIGSNNGYFDFVYTPTETGNGQAITCSVTFKKPESTSPTANIGFEYSLDRGTTWIALGRNQDFSEECTTKTEEIPAGVVTAANSRQFRFRVRGTRTGAEGDPPFYWVDDIKLIQRVLVIPSCPSLTAPANNARNVSVRPRLSWAMAAGAHEYRLSIGTTSGGTDILDNANVDSSYTFAVGSILTPNTKYYVKLIASNTLGDSTGCTETTFTTGVNPIAPYCGPMISFTPRSIAPITSVDIAGTTYASNTTATTIGAFEPHQSFVDKIFTIKDNVITTPITIKGIGVINNGWAMSVFIDWNNDGNFDSPGEAYFNTNASMVRSTTIGLGSVVTLTGNLPIPAGTPLGKKRMRVKYNLSGVNISSTLTTACEDVSIGQAKDYTISYEKYMAVSDVDKKNISVYPNPFRDVLQFSEIKDAKSITVADVSGKVIATPKVSQELNLSHLSKGVYFITVSYHNRPTKSFKVIKE